MLFNKVPDRRIYISVNLARIFLIFFCMYVVYVHVCMDIWMCIGVKVCVGALACVCALMCEGARN